MFNYIYTSLLISSLNNGTTLKAIKYIITSDQRNLVKATSKPLPSPHHGGIGTPV